MNNKLLQRVPKIFEGHLPMQEFGPSAFFRSLNVSRGNVVMLEPNHYCADATFGEKQSPSSNIDIMLFCYEIKITLYKCVWAEVFSRLTSRRTV